MKKNFYILILIGFLFLGEAKSQWVTFTMPVGFDLFDCSFPSVNTGYVCGYGNGFFKTTNSGLNWLNLSFPGTAHNLNAVHFINNETGFLCSTNDTMYRTTNGGLNWENNINMGYQVLRVQFIDGLTGFATGNARFSRTTNGGLNWTTTNTPSNGSMYFLNATTGWLLNYIGGGSEILKTTNSGLNWISQFTTSNYFNLYDVNFIDANTGWAVGYRFCIYKTTNGGQDWNLQNSVANANGLYSVNFVNSSTGWAVGDYYGSASANSFYTTNGGTDWISSILPTGGRMFRIVFNNSTTGWISSQYGRVFKTTNNGGLTTINESGNNLPVKYGLDQNYPNPFNPTTNLQFSINKVQYVTLKVYDILGREIRTLVNESLKSGTYEVSFDGSQIPSGIYFYKLESENFSETKKMILIK